MDLSAQTKIRFSLLPFGSFRPWKDYMMPIGISQSTDLNFYLLQKPLTDTPRNNVLPANWASFSPVKFTHKINHRSPVFRLWKSLIFFLSDLKQFLVLIFFLRNCQDSSSLLQCSPPTSQSFLTWSFCTTGHYNL